MFHKGSNLSSGLRLTSYFLVEVSIPETRKQNFSRESIVTDPVLYQTVGLNGSDIGQAFFDIRHVRVLSQAVIRFVKRRKMILKIYHFEFGALTDKGHNSYSI